MADTSVIECDENITAKIKNTIATNVTSTTSINCYHKK